MDDHHDGSSDSEEEETEDQRTEVVTGASGSEEEEEEVQQSDEMKDMSAWADIVQDECILKALSELGYTQPMPIQAKCIPVAIEEGLDILGSAQTGSGKTLAFAIPLVHFIHKEKTEEGEDGTGNGSEPMLRALVLAPTRELAIQVKRHIEAVAKYSTVSVGAVLGGLSQQRQTRLLNKRQPDIVVATPGRLWDFIDGSDSDHLSAESMATLQYLVIDEADRMTEKGHFEELTRLIAMLKESGQAERRTYTFSATLTFVHQVPERMAAKRRAKGSQRPRQKIKHLIRILGMRDNQTRVIDLTDRGLGLAGTPANQLLTMTKINCLADEKDLYLYYFLTVHPGRTLVFCNSVDCLRRLMSVLRNLDAQPLALHASMEQKKRLSSLERFAANPRALLVASDVAARGIDVADIDHVIHYQVPRTVEIYVHRSGRTARAMNTGLTMLLAEPKEAYLYKKLCDAVSGGIDLPSFPIDESLLRLVGDRVDLAQRLDRLEHGLKKQSAKDNWFKKAARECDIDLDGRSDIVRHSNDERDRQKNSAEARRLHRELASALKAPLLPASYYSSYLTKHGSFKLPTIKGDSAIDVVAEAVSKNKKPPCGPLGSGPMKRPKPQMKKKKDKWKKKNEKRSAAGK